MNDGSYSRGNDHDQGQGQGQRGNGRGRGKYNHKSGRANWDATNNHWNNSFGGQTGNFPPNLYGGPYGGQPPFFPAGGPHTSPFSSMQFAPDDRPLSVPLGGFIQHAQSQSDYHPFDWQLVDQSVHSNFQGGQVGATAGPNTPLASQALPVGFVSGSANTCANPPPPALHNVNSSGNVDLLGASAGGHERNVSPRQFTPALRAPTPQHHTTNFYNPVRHNLDTVKPVGIAPVPSVGSSMLSMPKIGVTEGSRSVSAGTHASAPIKPGSRERRGQEAGRQEAVKSRIGEVEAGEQKASKMPKTLKDLNNLEGLAVLNRSDLIGPLVDLRIKHQEKLAAIEAKRSETLTALDPLISVQQDHEDQARWRYTQATNSIEYSAKHQPGKVKDSALMDAAKHMQSASHHSTEATYYFSRVVRFKEYLEKLDRDAAKAWNEWYEGMNWEVMKALGQGQEEKDSQGCGNGELAKEDEKMTPVRKLEVIRKSDKVNALDVVSDAGSQKSMVFATQDKDMSVKEVEEGMGGDREERDADDLESSRTRLYDEAHGKTTDAESKEQAAKRASNEMGGNGEANGRSTSVIGSNRMTINETKEPVGATSALKKAAEPVQVNNGTSSAAKAVAVDSQQLKKAKKQKWKKQKDGGVARASSTTAFDEPSNKRAQKKGGADTRGSSTVSQKNGQGQGHGQTKLEKDKT